MRSTTLFAALLCVGVSPGAPARAQEPLQPLTLESMSSNVSIRGATISPGGGEIAVVSNRSGTSKIWLVDRQSGDSRLLLDDDASESSPAWSPQGDRIAFIRGDERGDSDIWVVSRNGGTPTRVTRDSEGERGPAWSPDGSRIAFISDRAGHQDVFVADVASGEVTQLTRETNPWDEARWSQPEWSADGRWVAYVSNRGGEYADDLWLVDTRTGATHKVTANLDVMTLPRWSPDGRYIAFNAMETGEFWYGDQSDIDVVEMPSEKVRKVEMNTFVSDRNGGIPMQWAPDSERIIFRYEWEGDSNLWSVPVEGGVATKMTYEEGSFGDFAVGPDGAVAYVRSTPTRGGELQVLEPSGGEPRRLTDWYQNYAGLHAPEKLAYRSKDGHYMLGYLYRPANFDPSRRYPSLVQVHGGGNNAYGNGFHSLEHLLAQEGYVVLAIEYRGSAGHGREFQDLSYGDWAAEQGWDAVAAAEYLESLPYTTDKVGIYGGSYGGIMTLAALTRDSEPFDAAAPLYGIDDWASAYEHGDRLMRFWIIEGHRGFAPGENAALYRRTLTIYHLDRIRQDLPFLVIHGQLDRRAPFQQSEQLVAALKARGNPVEFHSYPDEYHGFRRPQNRMHAYGALIAHFDKYLKGKGGS